MIQIPPPPPPFHIKLDLCVLAWRKIKLHVRFRKQNNKDKNMTPNINVVIDVLTVSNKIM